MAGNLNDRAFREVEEDYFRDHPDEITESAVPENTA